MNMLREQIIIRPPVADDFARWKELWDGYNAFYGREGETALPTEITKTTWGRFFDSYDSVNALVAESSGRILGLVHYIYHRSTIQIVPTCYLQDLFTAEEARGKGVGKALIEAVCEEARAAGVPRIYWHTHESNATAILLYNKVAEKSGFVVYRKAV